MALQGGRGRAARAGSLGDERRPTTTENSLAAPSWRPPAVESELTRHLMTGQALPYTVLATKKGELPISVDKRKWGKLVTTVDNVAGDVELLCTAIKGALGTGGHSLPGAVEVQGDQREAISAWLVESGCVKGLRRNKAAQVMWPTRRSSWSPEITGCDSTKLVQKRSFHKRGQLNRTS